jgi:hypothetical protein
LQEKACRTWSRVIARDPEDGKEGVDGSSPSEGSYESPATRGVSFFFRATRVGAISLDEFVNVSRWIAHVQTQPRFINDFVPYPANAVSTVSRSIYD